MPNLIVTLGGAPEQGADNWLATDNPNGLIGWLGEIMNKLIDNVNDNQYYLHVSFIQRLSNDCGRKNKPLANANDYYYYFVIE